jgi:hypothetical protein
LVDNNVPLLAAEIRHRTFLLVLSQAFLERACPLDLGKTMAEKRAMMDEAALSWAPLQRHMPAAVVVTLNTNPADANLALATLGAWVQDVPQALHDVTSRGKEECSNLVASVFKVWASVPDIRGSNSVVRSHNLFGRTDADGLRAPQGGTNNPYGPAGGYASNNGPVPHSGWATVHHGDILRILVPGFYQRYMLEGEALGISHFRPVVEQVCIPQPHLHYVSPVQPHLHYVSPVQPFLHHYVPPV